ncbi:hypothetical protein EFR84_34035 [Rhizobium chutanense]|uniref:Uncharacterized protein n=1 Tax=Rhizobium chutanense TaxID=2035448 RepID=A0A432N7G5_9HYPH|nr:hypothetical protein EFR84_34035 [Rhizobium chutanense]
MDFKSRQGSCACSWLRGVTRLLVNVPGGLINPCPGSCFAPPSAWSHEEGRCFDNLRMGCLAICS